jgi:hypothetical protein
MLYVLNVASETTNDRARSDCKVLTELKVDPNFQREIISSNYLTGLDRTINQTTLLIIYSQYNFDKRNSLKREKAYRREIFRAF